MIRQLYSQLTKEEENAPICCDLLSNQVITTLGKHTHEEGVKWGCGQCIEVIAHNWERRFDIGLLKRPSLFNLLIMYVEGVHPDFLIEMWRAVEH